jgi:hypothetical protein
MSVVNGTLRQSRISKAVRSSPELARTAFKTSREMDFFSERELITQIGHPRSDWPLCIAFGWLGQDSADSRRIFTGANWSSSIGNPFRRFQEYQQHYAMNPSLGWV